MSEGLEALGARRIFALADDENVASCCVCERIGMDQKGCLRHERVDPDERLRTTCLYAAVR